MAAAFIQAIESMTVPSGPLQKITSRRDFAEFYSSSFPLFAIGSQVDESDLREAAGAINEQARAELGFKDTELAEMGYPAAVPELWQLDERDPPNAVRWYNDHFNKSGTSTTDDPQWYPLGFLSIASKDWKKTGVVIVFYDALPEDEKIAVKAYRVDPHQVGSALISLRQGDDDYENVRSYSAMDESRLPNQEMTLDHL